MTKLKNAFDTSGESQIAKDLQKSQTLRNAMTKWVQKKRDSGIEPFYINLNVNAKSVKQSAKVEGKK